VLQALNQAQTKLPANPDISPDSFEQKSAIYPANGSPYPAMLPFSALSSFSVLLIFER
jgi:hypothetical protein